MGIQCPYRSFLMGCIVYQITDWQRYEVNSKGQAATGTEDLRVGPLRFIRLKVHGHSQGNGYRKLIALAKGKAMEVFGIFCKFLEISGDSAELQRGILRRERDGEPATIADLSFLLSVPESQIKYALKILTDNNLRWLTEITPGDSAESPVIPDQYNTIQDKPIQTKSIEEEFVNYWNSKETLPKIRAFPDARKAKLKARMKEPYFAENWQAVIDKVAASPFCCGENDRNWKADCTWILTNSDNYVKVMEGKYDERPTTQNQKRPTQGQASGGGCTDAEADMYDEFARRNNGQV